MVALCWRMLLLLIVLTGCTPLATVPATPVPSAPPTSAAAAPTATPVPATSAPTAVPATSAPTATALPATTATSPTPAAAIDPAKAAFVVYPRPDGSLWRHTEGGQSNQLVPPSDPNVVLPWAAAPDGTQIAYLSGTLLVYGQIPPPGTLALWVVQADGQNRRKLLDVVPPQIDLTPGGGDAFNLIPALTNQTPAWSPDGQRIALVSAHEGQADAYSVGLDGTSVRLTDTPLFETGLGWSPDGGLLAVLATTGFGTGAGWGDTELLLLRARGGAPFQALRSLTLPSGTSATFASAPEWLAPDLLATQVSAVQANESAIITINASDGSVQTVAQRRNASDEILNWSGPPETLAFGGSTTGLQLWRPRSSGVVTLTTEPIRAFAWDERGEALAYSTAAGVTLWAIGSEGDIRSLSGTTAAQLIWSRNSQLLAADGQILKRDGTVAATLSGQPQILGWGQGSLFWVDQRDATLRSWDGTREQTLVQLMNYTGGAGVVLPR